MAIQGAEAGRIPSSQWGALAERIRRNTRALNGGPKLFLFGGYDTLAVGGDSGSQATTAYEGAPSGWWHPYRGMLPEAARPALELPWPWEDGGY